MKPEIQVLTMRLQQLEARLVATSAALKYLLNSFPQVKEQLRQAIPLLEGHLLGQSLTDDQLDLVRDTLGGLAA
ncbi:MAG: hypothetical protein FWC42_11090 [Proteobacteria bacterium]|nr:hypothetical protein [Pseudomonadota bacterium]